MSENLFCSGRDFESKRVAKDSLALCCCSLWSIGGPMITENGISFSFSS